MTIRRTLLLSYLLISVASALLITLMIFLHFRDVGKFAYFSFYVCIFENARIDFRKKNRQIWVTPGVCRRW